MWTGGLDSVEEQGPEQVEGLETGTFRTKISDEVLFLVVTRCRASARRGWLRCHVIKGW